MPSGSPPPRRTRRGLSDGPHPARPLTPRLRTFTHQHPQGTDIGDHARFVLVLATRNDDQIITATEKLTDAYWTGTARSAGPATSPHLLGQTLTKVGIGLTRAPARR